MFGCLVVHNIHFDLESLLLKLFELLFVGFEYDVVSEAGDRFGEDTVGFVMVYDEVTNVPVQ